jgi:hypothetical protein
VIPHVHTGSPADWGWGKIVRHLHDDHDTDIPMAWDLGQAHQAHLKAHQTPEEKPVPHCAHQCPDAPIACTYEVGHPKLTDPIDTSGDVTHGEYDHGNARAGAWWVEVSEHVNQPEQTEGERRILVDRVICAMTGLDFDGEWVRDESLSLRRAMRTTYGEAAQRLIEWLERGGALHLPSISRLAADMKLAQKLQKAAESDRDKVAEDLGRERALVEDLEAANNTLREQLATTGRQLKEATGERDLLRSDKAQLTNALADAKEEREHALEAVMGAQSKAAALRSQLEEADQNARHLDSVASRAQHERMEAHSRFYEANQRLSACRAALGELVSDLKQRGWNGTLFQRLEAILDDSRLKEGATVVPDCTEPHLGLARTRELLAELTARIDVGHCGLDYRATDEGN